MGTYLSTPASEKYREWGEDLDCPVRPLRWAVVDMQGWRKSMEDAHVVEVTVPYPPGCPYLSSKEEKDIPRAKVFGVFDGHGGPEVARFCQLYLVSVLQQQALWRKDAATEDSPIDPAKSGIGQALIATFHALDRMVDDPNRRDEIIRLRTNKAPPTERRNAETIPPIQPISPRDVPVAKVMSLTTDLEPPTTLAIPPPPPPPPQLLESDASESTVVETQDELDELNNPAEDEPNTEEAREDAKDSNSDSDISDEDYDSDEAVGKEEAAERDQNLDDSEESSEDVQINPYKQSDEAEDDSEDATPVPAKSPSKLTAVFQKFLNMGDQSGQVVIRVGPDGVAAVEELSEGNNPAEQTSLAQPTGPSADAPSIFQNGRLICNLPDHAIHAGCTAVVAVLLGNSLTVANAGDSRAVLCREGGVTEPLSFDHKPQQPREMTRISNAGGFVNRFGRVNGNLNLSRSIGDLKYKQVPGIPPADQMITAEPDIVQVTLQPNDEFIILGCDGIWDCLTNEKAVEFVRERIDTKDPKEIATEMLNTILSDDPRATQGIGGDNMTVCIIDCLPHTRSYKVDPAWGPGES